jgi:uncharacterized protein (TIGR02646 family)
MRYVNRSAEPPPSSITAPDPTVTAERAAIKARIDAGESPPGELFQAYKHHDVQTALYRLFKGKCAYCESDIGAPNGSEIEHYRPKKKVTGADGHKGYWWLASVWTNLLPSCTGCNQGRKQHIVTSETTEAEYLAMVAAPAKKVSGKLNHFPIAGQRCCCPDDDLGLEEPLLIDPTIRDPRNDLAWSFSTLFSIVLPAVNDNNESAHGLATIQVCGLNRLKLVGSRTAVLKVLRHARTQMLAALSSDPGPGGIAVAVAYVNSARALGDAELPFSAMAEAFVDELAAELEAWKAARQRGE